MPMRVLIAEDEPRLAEALARGLRRNGFAVDIALDGDQALKRTARSSTTTSVVLDRDLPHVHGDEVCRQLVGAERPPRILMLTAAADVRARVEGLNLGADDYLTKPFAFAEVVARLHALQRRHARGPEARPRARRRAPGPGAPRGHARRRARSTLSPKEFGVLHVLLRADGAVVSPETLLERVWDEHVDPFTNTVRVTVMNLRRKLGDPGRDRDGHRHRVPSEPELVRLPRPSIRLRLTAWYATIFIAMGTVLLRASPTPSCATSSATSRARSTSPSRSSRR